MINNELWAYTPDEKWDTEKKLMRLGYIKINDEPTTYKKGSEEIIIIMK